VGMHLSRINTRPLRFASAVFAMEMTTVDRWRELAIWVGMGGAAMALLLPAAAKSDLQTIGDFQAWNAATFTDNSVRTCYAVSTPAESLPKNVRRGKIYVMVSRRSSEQTDELILVSGYPYKDGSPAQVSIDTSKFTLTTGNEFAWVPMGEVQQLVNAMIGGQEMTVEGISARGTETTDTYSLRGFTAAYRAMVKACK